MADEWIELATQGWPDFTVFGFHTGKRVEIKQADGTERTTLYMGYGEFADKGMGALDTFRDVTHWRSDSNPPTP